ncbi:PAS domain-containing protein [Ferrovibrio sp.]|uniref:PAS domain-containing protein n=1 Tax=Ferrovibrio sp. TaxID=1917215 RepID=UPI00260A030E|nr:PAS domain-containing protein [Ferrovibrio sp.]
MTNQLPATLDTVSQPRLRRMLGYWEGLRRDGALPARADIDPLDFPWMLGSVSLVEVHDSGNGTRRYRVRLVGTNTTERFGYETGGRWLDELPEPDYVEHITTMFDEVVRLACPMVERPDMMIDGRIYNYEVLRLPLGNDGAHPDMLLLAADFFDSSV